MWDSVPVIAAGALILVAPCARMARELARPRRRGLTAPLGDAVAAA
jgi:hypothetical protein